MKRINPLGFLILLITFITALVMFLTPAAFSNSVGFSYGEALGESNWGVNADYETQVNDAVKFGIEGQLQSGDAYAGNADVAVTLWKALRLESNNLFTGYEVSKLGRTNDLGASYVFMLGSLEVSAGLFGKNGNPFQPTYELKDPTDPNSAELKDSGILIKDGSSLNLALRTELEFEMLGKPVEVGLRGLLEVLGEEGTEKAHQLRADLQTGGQLVGGINWTAQAQVNAQAWGEDITWQRIVNFGVNYPF
jgi:hypothetical protein